MSANEMPHVIDVENLCVTLGENLVLDEVTMHVRQGEMVALLGSNGAGKSTLVRSILGLVPIKSGTVSLLGRPRNQFRGWTQIGYVPQHSALQMNNVTVRELVTSGRLSHRKLFRPLSSADRRAIDEAIETVHLMNRQHSQLRHLSGGQQQRALIARGLAGNPELLILDEPLAGVDLDTQTELAQLLGDLKDAGTSILVILHELSLLAPLIDRSVVLQTGKVIYSGALVDSPVNKHHHIDAKPGYESWWMDA